MNEYICMKCRIVFQAGESYAKCCGGIEIFNPEKHGGLLVGSSNSWIGVWNRWKDNPDFKRVSYKLSENGSFGAATAINEWISEMTHILNYMNKMLVLWRYNVR